MREIAAWRGPGLPVASALAERLGYAGEAGVRHNLKALEDAGYLNRFALMPGTGVPKVPRLTRKGRIAVGVETLPLKGRAHCGESGCQFEEDAEGLTFAQVFPLRGGEYFLLATGDCLAGGPHPIYPDDLVLVRPCSRVARPTNGSVVHVELPVVERDENDILFREYSYREEFDKKTGVLCGIVRLTHYYPRKVAKEYSDEQVDPRGVVVRIIGNPETGRGK